MSLSLNKNNVQSRTNFKRGPVKRLWKQDRLIFIKERTGCIQMEKGTTRNTKPSVKRISRVIGKFGINFSSLLIEVFIQKTFNSH